ncbi:hypothetical protein CTAYLR_006716 [Chrysophaeum taylorii]|uniref:DUS-like FMN-binding domain-containing protein n=1 Tax=Chrysophaeum taylorii TaxID=2483200 RepID=A0AAD7UAX9_9STRA|nr:hypothetical protein CTAYLR_006716 [Chrysophaeum taylorii]
MAWWSQRLGAPRSVLAPMVDQSELAFRELCRRYGVELCYTPMVHAGIASGDPGYVRRMFPREDSGPVIAQLAANDPRKAVATARQIADLSRVDAYDLNLGCPQKIARKGHYGAFLLENDIDAACAVVASLAALGVVTCKVRLLGSLEASVRSYRKLVASGAAALCVHGRTRHQNKQLSGPADWEAIRAVRSEFPEVPFIANGGVSCLDDATNLRLTTAADAVMAAEALLDNPALFSSHQPTQRHLAREYLDLALACDARPGDAKGHLFKLLHGSLAEFTDVRTALALATSFRDFEALLDRLDRLDPDHRFDACHTPSGVRVPARSWYWRHRREGDSSLAPTMRDEEKREMLKI